jgi:transcriptional regulator of acetoin/glycerol metabolism
MEHSPHSATGPNEPRRSKWRLLISGAGWVNRFVLDPPAALWLAADGRFERTTSAERPASGVQFVARADGVLELARAPDVPVLLNDVQLTRAAELRAGDIVQVSACSVLVQHETPPLAAFAPSQHSWSRQLFEVRLEEEVRRATRARRRLRLLFLRGPPPAASPESLAIVSQFSPAFAAVLDPEPDSNSFDPSVNAGGAVLSDDALTRDELIECALGRLPDEPAAAVAADERVVLDPMTVRLRALSEQLAMRDENVLIEGEPGTGKRLWARHMHLRSGRRSESWREVDGRRAGPHEIAAILAGTSSGLVDSGALLVRHVDQLPPDARQLLLDRRPPRLRIFATAASNLSADPSERLGRITVSMPALRDRPSEILPLALQALQHARARLRRPGLALNPEARAGLQAWGWPGNVRELRNEIAIAAQVAESDEIRLENLSPPIAAHFQAASTSARKRDLRESLKAAEKNALLGVLARTGWNVTAAAKELGLPRRTVVYRIARLGLRRPGR